MRPHRRRSAPCTPIVSMPNSLDRAAEPPPRRWLARWRRIGGGGCLGGRLRRCAIDRSCLSTAAQTMRRGDQCCSGVCRRKRCRTAPNQGTCTIRQNQCVDPYPGLGVQRPRRLRLLRDDRRRQLLRRGRPLRRLRDRRRLRADRTAGRILRPLRGRSLLRRRCRNRLHPAMPEPGALSDRVETLRARNRFDRRANRGRCLGRIDVRCDGARLGHAIPPSRSRGRGRRPPCRVARSVRSWRRRSRPRSTRRPAPGMASRAGAPRNAAPGCAINARAARRRAKELARPGRTRARQAPPGSATSRAARCAPAS